MRHTVLTAAWGLTAALLMAMAPETAIGGDGSDPATCPGVIATGPTSYQLTTDLGNCWIVRTHGEAPIIVDLNSHTWSGSFLFLSSEGNRLSNGIFDGSTLWIAGSLDHVTVRNNTIDFAVETYGPLTVTDCTFESNRVALSAYYLGYATVQNSVFRDNATGFVNGRGSGSLVESSDFENNRSGVFLWDEDFAGSNDVVVRDNHFSGNGVAIGVRALYEVYRAQIVNNQVDENDGAGISVDVYCNLLIPPFRPCGGQASVIAGNHVRRNGFAATSPGDGDGIRVRGYDLDSPVPYEPADPTGITISGNEADRNADLGIDASGVTDGGRNRAKFNGDPQQCVGVDCKVPGVKPAGKATNAGAAVDAERLMNLLAGLAHH